MSTQDFLRPLAVDLGLRGPGYTVFEDRLVLMAALPCGRGDDFNRIHAPPAGGIASFAQKNYYKSMVSRLTILVRALAAKESRDRREFRIFCNSPLPEKRFALEAGLGLQGKNSLIYLPEEGSFFVLGGILFPPDAAHPFIPSVPRDRPGEICGSCTACMEACPGGAISAPGTVDRRRCIQGRTAESGPLPPFLTNNWGTVLYGCDICQKVCPLNGNPPDAAETNFGVLGPALRLEEILAPRDGELGKTIFRGTVLDRTWIAETAIKRNAVLSAAALKAMELRPLIEPYGKHPEEGLREAALWALSRL